ncbi:MAG TPA: hypothetical protein VH760_11805 [Gaiellaceae bacterium]|jgi:hypothetical protein
MSFVRVVEFDGVAQERLEEIKRQMEEGGPPEGTNPTELIVLHDADGEKALVLVFFETEEDYRRGDEVLSSMPDDQVPGRRASVEKYELFARRTA